MKNPLAMQETWVRFLGWEDPLEKGMATHSSILAWRIPWTEEPGRLQSIKWQRVGHDRATKHARTQGIIIDFYFYSDIGSYGYLSFLDISEKHEIYLMLYFIKFKLFFKYHILIHIYGIEKNGTDEPICKAGIEMQT